MSCSMPSLKMSTLPLVSTTTIPSTMLWISFSKKVLDRCASRSRRNPFRNIPGGFQELDHFTVIVIDRRNGDHVKTGLALLVLVLLVGADQAFFFDFLQAIGDGTGSSVIRTGFVQSVSHFVAVLFHRLFARSPYSFRNVRFTVSMVMSMLTDHDPIGKGIEDHLGLLPGLLLNGLVLFFQAIFSRSRSG